MTASVPALRRRQIEPTAARTRPLPLSPNSCRRGLPPHSPGRCHCSAPSGHFRWRRWSTSTWHLGSPRLSSLSHSQQRGRSPPGRGQKELPLMTKCSIPEEQSRRDGAQSTESSLFSLTLSTSWPRNDTYPQEHSPDTRTILRRQDRKQWIPYALHLEFFWIANPFQMKRIQHSVTAVAQCGTGDVSFLASDGGSRGDA